MLSIVKEQAMDRDDFYWTMQTAIAYGGGFLKRLAVAALCADPVNRQKLMIAFPDIEKCYGPATHFHRQLRNQ